MTIVTLLSDFGTADGFVGAMKGVILRRAPQAQLVDLTHEIEAQDVHAGAWALREATPYFPPGTIHLAVVDPGVGTARQPLLLRYNGQLFVGPDNGLCSLAVGANAEAWVLDRPELFLPRVSRTFHGRDIFASVVGHLAAGREPRDCGTAVSTWQSLVAAPARREAQRLLGEVVHVDRFGNLVTNIEQKLLGDVVDWQVMVDERDVGSIRQTFGDVGEGDWVAYLGSSGLLEIAVREGSAAAGGHRRGSPVSCERIR